LKDIFDRENEIELLKNSLDSPLIVIMGLRRTGKNFSRKVDFKPRRLNLRFSRHEEVRE